MAQEDKQRYEAEMRALKQRLEQRRREIIRMVDQMYPSLYFLLLLFLPYSPPPFFFFARIWIGIRLEVESGAGTSQRRRRRSKRRRSRRSARGNARGSKRYCTPFSSLKYIAISMYFVTF
jgi:hypothetical protein